MHLKVDKRTCFPREEADGACWETSSGMHEPGCPVGLQTPPGRGSDPWLRCCGMKFPQAGVTSLHRCPFTGNLPQHCTARIDLKGLSLSRMMCILFVLLWLESHPHGRNKGL